MLRKLIFITLCITSIIGFIYIFSDLLELCSIGIYKTMLDESDFYILLSNKISFSGLTFSLFLLNMNLLSYVLINDSIKTIRKKVYKFSTQVKMFLLMVLLNLIAHLLFRDQIMIIVRLYSFIITYSLIITVINMITAIKIKIKSSKQLNQV